MKKLIIITMCALFVTACGSGAGGGSSLSVKAGGKDVPFAVKSSGSDKSVFTYTPGPGQPPQTATSFSAMFGNYEMDTTNFATMKKKLASADQARVSFSIYGESGTGLKDEVKPGTYKVDKEGRFMSVSTVTVMTFADGNDKETYFDLRAADAKGEIKVTSVTADAVSGSIDVTQGENSVKGNFTAKIAKK
ncbi:MAG: hypothetical protein IPK98_19145 [Chloracidobacterium sp.]|nr:hypothetical protein [Chloracidobacterium sp.]